MHSSFEDVGRGHGHGSKLMLQARRFPVLNAISLVYLLIVDMFARLRCRLRQCKKLRQVSSELEINSNNETSVSCTQATAVAKNKRQEAAGKKPS